MYLEKLEIQGFKSFAQKTIIEFPSQKRNNAAITAIVGPNGSGKSNVADAVRWVLGEQSIKLLRGKRSQDVIFSGSGKLSRLGFAEVALYLNNEDKKTKIDYTQIVVKRRVYRDGNGEYYINNSKVRLSDVQLLLAQANFGQRTYSVIGQGMADSILAATAQERKTFFDEATGVKQYQIKREQAMQKISTTENNLAQITGLLKEITPRLTALERQMKRLEKRSELEKKLRSLQLEHYGAIWQRTQKENEDLSDKKKKISSQHLGLTKKLTELQNKLEKLEADQKKTDTSSFDKIQQQYIGAMNEKNKLTNLLAGLEREISFIKEIPPSKTPGINVEKIVQAAMDALDILKKIEKSSSWEELKKLQPRAKQICQEIEKITKTEPPKENNSSLRIDGLQKKIDLLKTDIKRAHNLLEEKEKELSLMRQAEKRATSGVFGIQKQYQTLQQELNEVSSKKSQIDIELARNEAHLEDLTREIEKEASPELQQRIKSRPAANSSNSPQANESEGWSKIAKTKHELEMIGGIDPEIDEEYKETKERHDFLSSQVNDLQSALEKTKKAVKELDSIIDKEFSRSFEKIEKGFSEHFSTLFSGGKASLELNKQNELELISEELAAELSEEEKSDLENTWRMGIEIKASPPGKKVATISMLSGGERALTSIALICAIIQANPSPFVVLDEVDAALDESNSIKFSEILEKLSHITQFITITHNRATMEKARLLYGVTMGDDGVSKLLSVDLEKAIKNTN